MRIVIGALEDSEGRMREQFRQLSLETERVENVLRNMASFQGMEEIEQELNKCLDNMREDERVFCQMLTGLDRIREKYMRCEKTILQLYDQEVYTVKHREIGLRKIQENSDLIRNFIK